MSTAAELLKLKQVRNGHRTHAKKLMEKGLANTPVPALQELKVLLALLLKKEKILEQCDAGILNLLTDEEEIENEVDETCSFVDRIIEAKTMVESSIDIHVMKSKVATPPGNVYPHGVDTKPVIKSAESQIKLPKITLKVYDGSLLTWNNFWCQFDAAVHKNTNISDIQKFTYLKAFLTGEAESAIQGLSIIEENYHTAVDTLNSRFGNVQLRISAHMRELRMLRTVNNINDVTSLRKMYDTLELNISNLKQLKVDVSTYGSLLIAIIFDCIPEELRIKISLKFGASEWRLDETMKVFQSELEARERSLVVSGSKEQSSFEVNNYSTQSLQLYTAKESSREKNYSNKKSSKERSVICVFCKQKHLSSRCRNITDINNRYEIVKRENRCFVCLKEGHRSKGCRLNYTCIKCNQKHNISLCQQSSNFFNRSSEVRPNTGRPGEGKLNAGGVGGRETVSNIVHVENAVEQQSESCLPVPQNVESTTNVLVDSETNVRHDEIILQCSLADVCDVDEKRSTSTCVLFDGGSQRTYLTESLRNRLGLKCVRKENLILKRFASSEGLLKCLDVVQLCLKGEGGIKVYLEALCVPHICSPLKVPSISWTRNQYDYLRDVQLANPPKDVNDVEILVGLDHYFSIVTGRTVRGPPGTPVAVESILGWMVCGKSKFNSNSNNVITNLICSSAVVDGVGEEEEEEDLKAELMKFWEVDTLSGDVNDIVHEQFNNSITFNGVRYIISLPFKADVKFLPDNYQISYQRLVGLLNKLRKNPELRKKYEDIILSYEKDGIIEKVFNAGVPGKVHYLPHRAVIRDDRETTKVRIVLDGSAKEKGGQSINDVLHTGPCLLSFIYDILVRFCFGKIAIIADVKQAFLNVEVCESDKNFLRFLYVDPNDNAKIQIYRFNRVCFGITSSPFLLNATIQHHMNIMKAEYPELAVKFLRGIYVDDVTVNTVEEGEKFFEFASKSMESAGMQLQKWYSNSEELCSRMKCCQTDVTSKKVLGVLWNEHDKFVFDFRGIVVEALKMPFTKRNVLRIGAKFYDPMGMISPIVIIAKIYFQKVCLLDNVHWDDQLPDDIEKGWNEYLQQLALIQSIAVPRYLFGDSYDVIRKINLHGFCDSSTQAYCAVIYAEAETSTGTISRILTSKTKVAPINKLSIPRLELLSCLLVSELMVNLCRLLQDVVVVDRKFFWSDSEVALAWVKGEGRTWKSWVQNRVNKIKEKSDVNDWRYVNTKFNPADVATRDGSIERIVENDLWWYGPDWKKFSAGDLHDAEKSEDPDHDAGKKQLSQEINSALVCLVDSYRDKNEVVKNGVGEVVKFECYSNLMKLLRIIVYVLRFIHNCSKSVKISGEVIVKETDDALKRCVRWEQISITTDKHFKNLRKQLTLFHDDDGIIRLQGRLNNSHLPFDTKHPILLKNDSYFTRLVILHAHYNVKHMRVKATLNEVRSQFWISKGKQTVRSVIKDCVPCKNVNAKVLIGPPPPDLPEYRVCFEFAFTNVGVDYAGPLFVKEIYCQDSKMHKAYILLLTCAATRNIHIELTPSMSCPSLIRCLKRFIGRRGKFHMAVSDNFQTFISEELKQFLSLEKISWNHILPKSPWWGAFYERLIRIIKEALKKVVGKAKLTYEELETILIEIEMVVNSRPLTYLYEEAEEALTPSHLVIGRRLMNNFVKDDTKVDYSAEQLNSRYKYLQSVIEHYWKRFYKEYLIELHEHHLYQHKGKYDEFCKLLVGDVVLIKDDSFKRMDWKKGRVQELIVGSDGKVRGAVLKVVKGEKVTYIQRPVQRIVPLEVQKERSMDVEIANVGKDDSNDADVLSNSVACDDSRKSDVRKDDSNDADILSNSDACGDVPSTSDAVACYDSSKSDASIKRKRRPPIRFEVNW